MNVECFTSKADLSRTGRGCKWRVHRISHSPHLGRGMGQVLMNAIEAEARQTGRTTLILDTRAGDPSERLYAKLSYTQAGVIPEYARSTDGSLHTTVFMYKLLKYEKVNR